MFFVLPVIYQFRESLMEIQLRMSGLISVETVRISNKKRL